jgi:hypothetical protein
MAVEEWAKINNKTILAISKDDDWCKYCESSEKIKCIGELSDGLAIFNKANAPYAFLEKLESALDSETAKSFIDDVAAMLDSELDGFTPDQDADSSLYWEADGSNGWFKSFNLASNELRIIESDDEYIVLEGKAEITVEVEGEFSLSVHDFFDDENLYIDSVTATVEKEFLSEILITIVGDLEGPIEELNIEQVEIVSPIKRIHFGTLEPEFNY